MSAGAMNASRRGCNLSKRLITGLSSNTQHGSRWPWKRKRTTFSCPLLWDVLLLVQPCCCMFFGVNCRLPIGECGCAKSKRGTAVIGCHVVRITERSPSSDLGSVNNQQTYQNNRICMHAVISTSLLSYCLLYCTCLSWSMEEITG
jgi:hypothetical protein